MLPRKIYRLPPGKNKKFHRAQRLEWITIGFMLSIIFVMYLTMSSSQAMRNAWLEDILSLVPPIVFLLSAHFRVKQPNAQFPYGFSRATLLAFLCASVAILFFGLFMLYDSTMSLVRAEHPTLGTVVIFGHPVWAGWLAILALTYSAIPPVILGKKKLPLARELHEKTLYADAAMNKADWSTAVAAIVGILGIALGWWWADSVAAGLIALDVTRDGVSNLRNAVMDLTDERPTKVGSQDPEETPGRLRDAIRKLDWVERTEVRMRSEGHIFSGEIFILPTDYGDYEAKLSEAKEKVYDLDWRIYELTFNFVEPDFFERVSEDIINQPADPPKALAEDEKAD